MGGPLRMAVSPDGIEPISSGNARAQTAAGSAHMSAAEQSVKLFGRGVRK